MREKYLIKEALESSETLATVLYIIVKQYFGDDAFYWDPSTLFLELRDEFNAEPSSEVMDRISAVQVIITSDAFFNQPDAFINISNTIADGSPNFSVFNPAELEEIAWTLVEVAIIRDLLPFGYTVKKYVTKLLEAGGYGADYPDLFDEMLGKSPDRMDIIEGAVEVAHEDQRDKIQEFVDDNLKDLVYQASKIQSVNDALWKLMKEDEMANVTRV